ncbi:hypothetical protein D3C85_795410 [compost metagenome]
MGQDPSQHMHERQALAGNDGGGGLRPGQQQADDCQQHNAHAHAPQPEPLDQQHAQRGADRQRAITGDAVPGNDLGGVRCADPANTPADGA